MENSDFEPIIRDFFQQECGLDNSTISNTESIFLGGHLDSMDVMLLITFLENQFSIKINPLEVSLEQLDNINAIITFVQGKLN